MSDPLIYFIQADENGPIKIGFTSDDPMHRLSRLQTGNPAKLKLLGAVKGTSVREKQFHAELSQWRLHGEWFESHPTVLAAIQDALSSSSTTGPSPSAISDLIDAFGGISEFARAIDLNGPSTASEMKRSKSIRVAYWPKIIAAAAELGIAGVSSETLMLMHLGQRAPTTELPSGYTAYSL